MQAEHLIYLSCLPHVKTLLP